MNKDLYIQLLEEKVELLEEEVYDLECELEELEECFDCECEEDEEIVIDNLDDLVAFLKDIKDEECIGLENGCACDDCFQERMEDYDRVRGLKS